MALAFDPEYAEAVKRYETLLAPLKPAVLGEIEQRRRDFEHVLREVLRDHAVPDDVSWSDFSTRANDGSEVLLRWYTKDGSSPGSAVYYTHGGGMILNDVAMYDRMLAPQVSATGVPFLSVEYRKAPEHPHPTPVEDCYAGLVWLAENSGELGVDPNRIAVMGDSAGGGIAAALAIMARDREGPKIAAQILLCPMLDDRNTASHGELDDFVSWGHVDNKTAWSALLGPQAGGLAVSPYAAPARLTDPKGLPRLYMDLGELDLFREEDLAYAALLASANIPTELHLHPGTPHGWWLMAPDIGASVRAVADRNRVIRSL